MDDRNCAGKIFQIRTMTLRSALLVVCLALCCLGASAQTAPQLLVNPESIRVAAPASESPRTDSQPTETKASMTTGDAAKPDAAKPGETQFRVERLPLVGGAELLTIFARLDGM